MTDQRRRRRHYNSREEAERQRRIRRRRAMKRRLQIKRRIYFCLFLFVVVFTMILITRWKKSGGSVSENSVSADAAQQESMVSEASAGIPGSQLPVEERRYTTGEENSLLDVTKGTVAVDFSSVSENRIEMAARAKQAMAGVAYFTGSNLTLNEAFTVYGSGEWHAIVNKQEDLCVFYTGVRDGVSFRINFEVYDDGTFVLVSASQNGEEIEDYVGFVTSIVRY